MKYVERVPTKYEVLEVNWDNIEQIIKLHPDKKAQITFNENEQTLYLHLIDYDNVDDLSIPFGYDFIYNYSTGEMSFCHAIEEQWQRYKLMEEEYK